MQRIDFEAHFVTREKGYSQNADLFGSSGSGLSEELTSQGQSI